MASIYFDKMMKKQFCETVTLIEQNLEYVKSTKNKHNPRSGKRQI